MHAALLLISYLPTPSSQVAAQKAVPLSASHMPHACCSVHENWPGGATSTEQQGREGRPAGLELASVPQEQGCNNQARHAGLLSLLTGCMPTTGRLTAWRLSCLVHHSLHTGHCSRGQEGKAHK